MDTYLADITIGRIIGLIIAGLIVGALGRLFHPGRDPMGLGLTILIGIAAVIVAGLLIGGILGFILAIVIGIVLVALVGRMTGRRGGATAGI
jgi:uncharacterized membrane protein YeaQ/YmgE (transglycosylase-associated protein family)